MTIKPSLDLAIETELKGGFAQFFAETAEREAALSAVALLDTAIGDYLKAIMIDDTNAKIEMFGERGYLNGFGARIRSAYIIGMISREFYKELKIINSIRNEFAHQSDANNFEFPRIQGLASGLLILKDPTKFLKYLTYSHEQYYGLPDEKLWPLLSKIFADLNIDLTKANWGFIIEVIAFNRCFARSLREDTLTTRSPLFCA